MPIAYASFLLAVQQLERPGEPGRHPFIGSNEGGAVGACRERFPPPCMTYRVVGHVGRECLHNALDVRTVVVICDMRVKALAALRPMVCAVPRESVSVRSALMMKA